MQHLFFPGNQLKPGLRVLPSPKHPLMNGLEGAWYFNGNGLLVNDYSLKGRPGTGGGLTFGSGPYGQTGVFDGSTTVVTIGNLAIFEAVPNFSAWIRFCRNVTTGDQTLCGKIPSNNASGWWLGTTSNTNVQFFQKWSTTSVTYNCTVPAMGTGWHDCLLQIASDGYAYITFDSVNNSSAAPGSGSRTTGSASFSIGSKDTGVASTYLNGEIDFVLIRINPPFRDAEMVELRKNPYVLLEPEFAVPVSSNRFYQVSIDLSSLSSPILNKTVSKDIALASVSSPVVNKAVGKVLALASVSTPLVNKGVGKSISLSSVSTPSETNTITPAPVPSPSMGSIALFLGRQRRRKRR